MEENIIEGNFPIIFEKKKHEYENVYSFTFLSKGKFPFLAGQSAHLTFLDEEDEDNQRRSMSFASSPQDKDLLFSMRVRKESLYKQKFANLKKGDMLHITRIKGKLILPDDETIPIVLVAGGIGITPFRSILRDINQRKAQNSVILIHVNSSKFLFKDELEKLPQEQFRIRRPYLQEKLLSAAKQYPSAIFYIAGSNLFLEFVSLFLKRNNVKENMIRTSPFKKYEDFLI